VRKREFEILGDQLFDVRSLDLLDAVEFDYLQDLFLEGKLLVFLLPLNFFSSRSLVSEYCMGEERT
jgi:hypothetical protein